VIDAWLFPVAIVVQVFFVGLSLFTGQALWSIHITFGHALGLLPLLLVCLSSLGRLPSAAKRLAWLVLGVYLIHAEVFAAIRADAPLLAAFHPVLALVLFALAPPHRSSTLPWKRKDLWLPTEPGANRSSAAREPLFPHSQTNRYAVSPTACREHGVPVTLS